VVGPLVAAALLGVGWELRSVFWVALAPGLLSVLCVLTIREPDRTLEVGAKARIAPGVPERLPGPLRGYLGILLFFSLGCSTDAFLLLRAEELGLPVATLPLLWTVLHVAKGVSSYLGGAWSDRLPRVRLIGAGWLVYAATYLAFGAATEPWHAWALFVVYGAYHGLTEPAERALVKDLAPAAVRGRAYGFYNLVTGASAVPAGLLTGWLWQTVGPRVALTSCAGIAMASLLALGVWSARRGSALAR
jgi:MFS family permease